MRGRRTTQAIVLLAGFSITALAGCSGSSSNSDATPTETAASPVSTPTVTPTETAMSPTSSPTETDSLCSEQGILAVLPEGSEMVKYNCADVSGTQWAAVEVNPGPTVFFLQASGGSWDVSTSDEVCGTASAGLPPELLDYCNAAESSS